MSILAHISNGSRKHWEMVMAINKVNLNGHFGPRMEEIVMGFRPMV